MSEVHFADPHKSPDRTDYPLHNCRITSDSVYINDARLPDFIAADGVTVFPAGKSGVNKVMVTFVVSEVTVEDPAVPQVKVEVGGRAPDVQSLLSAYAELEVTKGNEG